jgi:hypothetical protein
VWLADDDGLGLVEVALWLAVGVALDEGLCVAEALELGLAEVLVGAGPAAVSAESSRTAAFGRLAHEPFTIGGPPARSEPAEEARTLGADDKSTKPVTAPRVADLASCVLMGTTSPSLAFSKERIRLSSSSQYASPD